MVFISPFVLKKIKCGWRTIIINKVIEFLFVTGSCQLFPVLPVSGKPVFSKRCHHDKTIITINTDLK